MIVQRWVVGIVAVCVALSILVTVVDNRIFSRGKLSRRGVTPSAPGPSHAASRLSQPSDPSNLLDEASAHIDQASEHTRLWRKEIEPILDGPGGEAVAENDEFVDKLAFLTREDRTSLEEIESTRQRITVLQEVAKGKGTMALSAAELNEIREIHSKSLAADQEWEFAVAGARAIVGLATSKASPESELNLDERVAQANHQAALADLDRRRVQREIEAAEERDRIAKEKEILERAMSPEVTSLLAPFLEPRDVQPRLSGSSVRFGKTLYRKPMSLAALQGMGALTDSLDGLKRLALVGGARDLSEPKWSVHSQPGNWTDSDKEMLQQAQNYLQQYGAILVDHGKLSP